MNTTGKPAFLDELQAFLAKPTSGKDESALMLRPRSLWALAGLASTNIYEILFHPSRMKPKRIGA
jgi:hypothetical protein